MSESDSLLVAANFPGRVTSTETEQDKVLHAAERVGGRGSFAWSTAATEPTQACQQRSFFPLCRGRMEEGGGEM